VIVQGRGNCLDTDKEGICELELQDRAAGLSVQACTLCSSNWWFVMNPRRLKKKCVTSGVCAVRPSRSAQQSKDPAFCGGLLYF
jgi:hypothetical protein